MSPPSLYCPNCESQNIVKNGKSHNGKQNHKCNDCGRQFIESLENRIIDDATKDLLDKLLLEQVTFASISRILDISESWLQEYVNANYVQIPRQVLKTDSVKKSET